MTCVLCNAPMTGHKRMYCDKTCRNRAFSARRIADGRLKEQHIKHRAKRKAWYESAKESRTCAGCGVAFMASRYNLTTHCSETCAQQMRYGVCLLPTDHPAMMLMAEARKAERMARWEAARKPTPPRIWVMGWCQRCDTAFVIIDQKQTRYCTDRCADGDAKARRRAVKRLAFVAPVYRTRIFKRDKWTCQLCGKKVKRDAVAPHPRSPSLDHILPLSLGGTHEPANVQLACFLCNSIKGDRLYLGQPEQLALVG